ncbi:ABC transporter ATP-binding protein [Desulfohalovibrio reitneri]|uniref:ABC transporter ATP-binding protein n=1 Tax=Desulfohalovibrio reitneri TaxID=1307759 RepID=UPI0006900A13|nr:ABC transporter ATP-binding protein [Desulfohalovibrio reitneri]
MKEVSLEVEDGAFMTILGPSDAGKTTLLRIMCGIDMPDRGRVFFDGKDVTKEAVQKLPVAMVYQQFINYPSMSVYENIASPLRLGGKKLSKGEIDRKVRENAQLLGLSQVLDHFPEEISGGQKQRVAIARALTKEAKFTFLDEPLANLDYKLREELRGELKNILRQKGGVVVYATPDPVDVLSMATHVAYLQEGEILQVGEMEDVYRMPRLADVGNYFSYPSMNLMQGKLHVHGDRHILHLSQEVSVDVTEYADRLHRSEYIVGVRAYNLKQTRERPDMVPMSVSVRLAERIGSDTELHLEHYSSQLVMLVEEFADSDLDESIEVYLDPKRLFLYDTSTRELVLKTDEPENNGPRAEARG